MIIEGKNEENLLREDWLRHSDLSPLCLDLIISIGRVLTCRLNLIHRIVFETLFYTQISHEYLFQFPHSNRIEKNIDFMNIMYMHFIFFFSCTLNRYRL